MSTLCRLQEQKNACSVCYVPCLLLLAFQLFTATGLKSLRLVSRSVADWVSCCRSPRHEFLSGAQIILVLLVLMVQLWTLYDNMVLHGRLAAAAPCWLAD